MDSFARGLVIADRIITDKRYPDLKDGRYASFDSGAGKRFEQGELSLVDLRDIAAKSREPEQLSGKQELLENVINDAIARGC
jgi:xylose isomerase